MTFLQAGQIGFDFLRITAVLALGSLGFWEVRRRIHGRWPGWLEGLVSGAIFAGLGALGPLASVMLSTGNRLDLRAASVMLATLFAGLEAGLVTALLLALVLAAIGDPLIHLYCVSLALSFALSGIYGILLRQRNTVPDWRNLLAAAFVIGTCIIVTVFPLKPPEVSAELYFRATGIWLIALMFTVASVGSIIRTIERNYQTRHALEERESELRAILDNSPIAMFLKDREGRFRLVNRRFEEWYQKSGAEIYGQIDLGAIPATDSNYIRETDAEVIRDGHTTEHEHLAWRAGPGIEQVLVTKFPVRDSEGRPAGIAGFILDTTARKRAEAALRQSEERFRALIEHSNDMVIVITVDGIVTYRSPSASEILGFRPDEVVSRPLFHRVHPDDRAEITDKIGSIASQPGSRATGRSRVQHEDGSWRTIAWNARNACDVPGIDGIVLNSRDVTEALNVEGQLQQAQKMEAIGQLAGGIAHDFNNVLSAIRGFAGFLQQDLAPDSPQHGFADRIVSACEQARDLVRQILAFSRQDGVALMPSELTQIVRETQELLRAAMPASTWLEVTCLADELVANVNPGQISQILLNLCLNANDALAGEPGVVSIEVTRIDGAADYAQFAASAAQASDRPGDEARLISGTLDRKKPYARIRVTDTGSGIGADVLKRIFDPFFTTKERGRGTGLGLSVVHGIVAGYGGSCTVTSRLGKGSVFTIYLPVIDAAAVQRAAVQPALTVRGRERLLVVDDEVDVCDMLTIGLERLGYDVVAVNDPRDAIDAVTEDPTAWDAVICDQVMPRMTGLDVAKRLKSIRPSLRFILCTGFSEGLTQAMAHAEGADVVVHKPVAVDSLAATLRRLLDDRPSAPRLDNPTVSAG